jgi:hypothetical protein
VEAPVVTERRRPRRHVRHVNGKVVPVNPDVDYDDPKNAVQRPGRAPLFALVESSLYAQHFFDPAEPLDRDAVAAEYGQQWRDAELQVVKVLAGYAAAEYEMSPRHVNYLVLPDVDPVEALRSYFAEEAQRNPDYAWGNPDSWSQEFTLESVILFDDDAHHYTAGITHPDRLAAHGIQVLNTTQPDWLPEYHEFSRERYSLQPHVAAVTAHFPEAPYLPLDYDAALTELTARGDTDPAEFSVLLWLGEIELRDKDTFAVTDDKYDPDSNHIPPWAVQNYL